MVGPTDLFDCAAEWLAACNAVLALTDAGPIDRAYVSPGPPSWDCCPQLTVHAGYVMADTQPLAPFLMAGHRADVTGGVIIVPLVCTVIRCCPVFEENGDPPSGPEYEAVAAKVTADAWSILNFTWNQYRDGLLFAPACDRELFLDPGVPLQPAGGCAGFQIQVRVTLFGFQPSS